MASMNDQNAHWRSYETRTLLTNIIGFAEMLADPCLLLSAKTRYEYAEIIFACGLVLAEKIEAMTDAALRESPPRHSGG